MMWKWIAEDKSEGVIKVSKGRYFPIAYLVYKKDGKKEIFLVELNLTTKWSDLVEILRVLLGNKKVVIKKEG